LGCTGGGTFGEGKKNWAAGAPGSARATSSMVE
jgi:hypothetical protein